MWQEFSNLRELHIAVPQCFDLWVDLSEGCKHRHSHIRGHMNRRSCRWRNVNFRDLKTGLMLNGHQMRRLHQWRWQNWEMPQDPDDEW
ncbi:hypothetical protein F5Y16DRAFT_147777 [Xylariaceae sp. FL0255]|nr:hypothetical protein F5Y16DRAFT_147777 [Xylariaceae sp. FL0255]